MKMLKPVYILLCVQLLCSCAAFNKTQTTSNPAITADAKSQVNLSVGSELLSYPYQFNTMSPDAQKKELQLLSPAKGSVEQKIKLAIIYSMPSSRYRDTAKAQNMLDEVLHDKNISNDQKNLSLILKEFIADYAKSSNRIRDEQKRADLAQSRADQLQQKLEELKNIEKTMMNRDQGNVK